MVSGTGCLRAGATRRTRPRPASRLPRNRTNSPSSHSLSNVKAVRSVIARIPASPDHLCCKQPCFPCNLENTLSTRAWLQNSNALKDRPGRVSATRQQRTFWFQCYGALRLREGATLGRGVRPWPGRPLPAKTWPLRLFV